MRQHVDYDADNAAPSAHAQLPEAVELAPEGVAPRVARVTTGYERYGKPVLDRAGAAALLLLAAPVMALVALVVLVALGRPVLLRQQRIGKDGRPFPMLKFRTMRPDRRRRRGRDYGGPERRTRHKHPDDPRHVPVGRVLRALSLDELPQLLNVLRGDMSLVGPRPELPFIVAEHYQPHHHGRHAVKPGITGLWQVTERADAERLMHTCVDTDLRYVRLVTFRRDLAILLRTVPALLGLKRGR